MNWLVTIAGAVAAFMVVGHFVVGTKRFLKPMLAADFDPVARKTMHCVFHYVSAFLILSSVALLLFGTGIVDVPGSVPMVKFIALNYAAFAVWQIVIALTSGIERPLMKMFQWTMFAAIAVCAWLGAWACEVY